jgi:hypothetical protein
MGKDKGRDKGKDRGKGKGIFSKLFGRKHRDILSNPSESDREASGEFPLQLQPSYKLFKSCYHHSNLKKPISISSFPAQQQHNASPRPQVSPPQ